MKKNFFYFFGFFSVFLASVNAQKISQVLPDEENSKHTNSSVLVTYNGGRNYSLVERTDLRRYDNNRYVGLVSREVHSFITNEGDLYDGSFYIDEGTKHQNISVAQGIHDSIPSTFRITADGTLVMIEDHGYPSFRSFPAFPKEKIKKGDSWQARAERTADPLNKGISTKIPMEVQYTYIGDEKVQDEDVFVFSAKWASRYGYSYIDPAGDRELKTVNGSHDATMYVSKKTGYALVVRDSVNEQFVYTDGKQITLKGTISLFTKYPPAVDRSRLIPALQRIAELSDDEVKSLQVPQKSGGLAYGYGKSYGKTGAAEGFSGSVNESHFLPWRGGMGASKTGNSGNYVANTTPKDKVKNVAKSSGIKVENTTAGIRLTIQDLKFKADSAELLPGEEIRLDKIASVLKEAPNSQFLVEGHTASTGYEEGEMKLSSERAKAIASELSKRGISKEKFICKGSGSHKPVADNSTAEGKAANRRVEITILE